MSLLIINNVQFVFRPPRPSRGPRRVASYKRPYKNLSGTNMYIHYKMYNIILCIYNHNINLINNREKYIYHIVIGVTAFVRVTLEHLLMSAL